MYSNCLSLTKVANPLCTFLYVLVLIFRTSFDILTQTSLLSPSHMFKTALIIDF